MKRASALVAAGFLSFACSSEPEDEASATSNSELSCGGWVPDGQCLASVQQYFRARGVEVGTAPGYGAYDAQGRWCESEGACLLWVLDIPSRYGWHRTSSPGPGDIAVFSPKDENPWGHVTIVDHVDGSGVWMVDSNDDGYESANNTPHLHSRAPYGYYRYGGDLGCGARSTSSAPSASTEGADCRGWSDALYCGHNYVNGDPNVLYRCSGGVAFVEAECPAGCRAMPDGSDDRCD